MFAYAATDLLGKRKIDNGSVLTAAELLLSCMVLAFGAALVIFACGLGESGRAPWMILKDEPLVFCSSCCSIVYLLLCLFSFRYLGLSVDAAVSGTGGIVFFCGILLINLFSGKLAEAREMLHPARLVPILVALICIYLLPWTEKTPLRRRRTVLGVVIILLAMLFDGGGESLITAIVFSEGRVGLVDYMLASWFGTMPAIILLSLVIRGVRGRWFVPFRRGDGMLGYSVLAILSSALYLVASSLDAVRTGVVFIVAPVVTMLAAHVFLKERYSWRQNLCIWTVEIAAIAFCIADLMF